MYVKFLNITFLLVPLMQGKYSFGMHLHVAAAKPRLSGIHLSGKPTIRTSFPGNENMQP